MEKKEQGTVQALDTIEIETGNQTVQEIADEICVL